MSKHLVFPIQLVRCLSNEMFLTALWHSPSTRGHSRAHIRPQGYGLCSANLYADQVVQSWTVMPL